MSTQSKIFSVMRMTGTRERANLKSKSIGTLKSAPGRISMLRATQRRLMMLLVFFVVESFAADDADSEDAIEFKEENDSKIEDLINGSGDDGHHDDLFASLEADVDAKVSLEWVSADEAFKVKINGKDHKTTVDGGDTWLGEGALDDGELTEEEWNELNGDEFLNWLLAEDVMDTANWVWLAVSVVGGLLLGLLLGYCCGKKSGAQTQPSNQGHYRRRLRNTPIAALSHEIDPDILTHRLTVGQTRPTSKTQDSLSLPGIWWMIPLSCITQLFWIYVAYKIYKSCCKKPERNSPKEELREITVRR